MGNHESKPEWRPTASKKKPMRKIYDESTYKLNDWGCLERFIYLGSESSYNANDKDPNRKNAECIDRLIGAGKGVEVVHNLSDISLCGRTLRQNYLIFALAICARSNDEETKKEAYKALNAICRIPTHFFLFVNYCKQESLQSGSKGCGWGRAHRRAMIKWYEEKAKHPVCLARLLTKYKSRRMHTTDKKGETWSHSKILKKAHPKFEDDFMKVVKQYIFNGFKGAQSFASNKEMNSESISKFLTYIDGTEKAKRCTDEDTLAALIKEYNLEREHIPTQMVKCPMVCKAIMTNMKAGAKVRNICLMSSRGLCNEGSECEKEIIAVLSNEKALHDERVHPIRILIALLSYKNGEHFKKTESKNGMVNTLKWNVNQNICQALNAAFYQSFITVQSSEKRFLIAISCSEDMDKPCNGCPAINCKQAAAAMTMLTIRTEKNCKVVGFSDGLKKIILNKNDSLEDVTQKISEIKGTETDVSNPVRWALEKKKTFDVFIIYSDNIKTEGNQAIEALTEYQKEMKTPNAKLIVVAMLATDSIIADERNPFILNIVGFDKKAALRIQEFATSEI
ncbi:RNA-binding protein RO60-like [Ruditapes philippinarum]|uniref:RNA-binding protein RO60-like n=1 Tax=Ruditapes philippinarum TaxID=129788 RepID=UPI00295BAF59|nr:RNA-binding protein RO60-like [Ruditapes philippinarum]XP_060561517.1 RNA-binding protein RO60-like [Ruditapes philippinarum]